MKTIFLEEDEIIDDLKWILMMEDTDSIKLTMYSHGAGCGCKISPAVLSKILEGNESAVNFPGLLVGNDKRDDAAVFLINDEQALISTTDFFMPIVDDPFDFGRIAATNAISDVYAMGGKPILAIAILGWPIDKIAPAFAGQVLAGARQVCENLGIALGGGHSIDCPEPVFGLAVNGLVHPDRIKQNSNAREGDKIYLTKQLGVGILSTASKKGIISDVDLAELVDLMTSPNSIGEILGEHEWIHALTDVTGFGLLGHLKEMAEGSRLTALIDSKAVPVLSSVESYLKQQSVPGGTNRNWQSFGDHISALNDYQKSILCDPQTSGGLLVSVAEGREKDFADLMRKHQMEDFCTRPIGTFTRERAIRIEVS